MSQFPGRFFRLGELPPNNSGMAPAPLPPIGTPPPAEFAAYGSGPTGTENKGLSDRQSYWQSLPFTAGTVAIKIQDFLLRKFFLIQNRDGANTIYIGFGWEPSPNNSLVLGPGWGYEPYSYPVNEIWVAASGANTTGLLITGT